MVYSHRTVHTVIANGYVPGGTFGFSFHLPGWIEGIGVRLYGIPETPNEKTDEVVREVVKERLNIELNPSDIARSHRITPKPKPGSTARSENPKPIIVKFNTYNTRQAVFDAKSRLRGTKIFIQEDLTPHRRELLNAARQKSTVKRVWTNDGKITVLVSVPGSNDRKVTIRNKSDIERLQ